jgi:hypothetical protein
MNIKIDIFQLTELGNHSSDNFYFGSLIGQTNKKFEDLIRIFHRENFCTEGLKINAYNLNDLAIIELTGFLVDGEYLKNIVLNSKDIEITNDNLGEIDIQNIEDSEFIILNDEATNITFPEINSDLYNDDNLILVKNISIVEWGASSYLENFIINIISNFTSTFIEKFLKKGITLDAITKFKLPTKIKTKIANEYNIKPNSLFLESYHKVNSTEYISFRSLYFKVEIVLEKGELLSLKTESLNKYLYKY